VTSAVTVRRSLGLWSLVPREVGPTQVWELMGMVDM